MKEEKFIQDIINKKNEKSNKKLMRRAHKQ